MSSSSSSPMSAMPKHIDSLSLTLRQANAYHSQLAAAARASVHPSHKARMHAEALHLSISIEAASNLAQSQISTIPLPVLDLTSSPLPANETVTAAQAPADAIMITSIPDIVAPRPRYPSEIDYKVEDMTRPARPALRCAIPAQPVVIAGPEAVRPTSVELYSSRCNLISSWSASTTGSNSTYEEEEDDEAEDIPQPAQVRVRYPHADDNDSMDILVSPDEEDEEDDETFGETHPRFVLSFPPVPQHVDSMVQQPPNDETRTRPLLPTRIPRQEQHPVEQIESSPPRITDAPMDVPRLSSGSDSSQSTNELVSPFISEELPSLMIRIKRKSLLDDDDSDDGDNDRMILEKRPKFERKSWVIPASERKGHQRTPSGSNRRRI